MEPSPSLQGLTALLLRQGKKLRAGRKKQHTRTIYQTTRGRGRQVIPGPITLSFLSF